MAKFNSLGQWSTPPAETTPEQFKKGLDAVMEAFKAGDLPVLRKAPPQPTNEQLFGHLVVSEEQAAKAQAEWEGRIAQATVHPTNVDELNKSEVTERAWEPGRSFNSLLTEEELKERNGYVGE